MKAFISTLEVIVFVILYYVFTSLFGLLALWFTNWVLGSWLGKVFNALFYLGNAKDTIIYTISPILTGICISVSMELFFKNKPLYAVPTVLIAIFYFVNVVLEVGRSIVNNGLISWTTANFVWFYLILTFSMATGVFSKSTLKVSIKEG